MDEKRLHRYASKCIMKVVKDILDYLEIVMPKEQFELVRKRILRSGNNEIRAFEEILKRYKVEYKPQINEVIVFNKEDG